MVKKLSKYGNSLALIIDKPILELLNIQEDTPLKITTDGKAIFITPDISAKTHKEKLKEFTEEAMDEYSEALQKLADSEASKEKMPFISERKEVQEAAERVMKKYANALKKLADS